MDYNPKDLQNNLYLQPKMSKSRENLIRKAFQKLDKTGDGFVTVEDLKGVYNVKQVRSFFFCFFFNF